ncbi:MAG: L-rhamnose/proton symporter RhaT [Prolixibacteraceae bacterium]|jgi:L-rhamnose-H+ transport protein
MNLSILIGIVLIAIGAFSSGSFAVPFGKIRGWQWESYWLVFSLAAYIVFPLLANLAFSPDFVAIYRSTPLETIVTVFLLGVIYGVGNLSFGLALRYLGLSLGYALSLGLMLAIGTLVPPLLDGRLHLMMQNTAGTLLILGVAVACVGIALSAWSGILKDKPVSDINKQKSTSEFNLIKGAMASVLVGITGSAMSLGFEEGYPISKIATEHGVDPLFSIIPVLMVLFSGTFFTTIIWCLYLGFQNNLLKDYFTAKSVKVQTSNYLFCFLAGVLWFGQFIVYGMGKSKMGPFTFTSWGILMALTIVFATVWGLFRKEWKGATTKVYVIMILSQAIIIASSFLIGISGSV